MARRRAFHREGRADVRACRIWRRHRQICPPLVITEAALRESLEVFAEAFAESL